MPLKMSMLLFLFSAFWHLLILSYYFWQELLDGWLDDQDWEETRPLFMLYLVCLQVGLTALVLPPVNYLGLGLVRDLDELPRQLATFRVQDASCFCCSNGHRNPITGEQLPCDRELVHQTLRGWYRQTSESTDHEQALDFFNELVQSRLSTSVLSSMTTSLPLGWVLSIVGVCHVPIVVSLQSQIVRLWSMYGVWDDLPGLVAFTLRSLIECTYPLLLLLLAARLFLPLLRLGLRLQQFVSRWAASVLLLPIMLLFFLVTWLPVEILLVFTEDEGLTALLPFGLLLAVNACIYCPCSRRQKKEQCSVVQGPDPPATACLPREEDEDSTVSI